jgi:hypothetical protein
MNMTAEQIIRHLETQDKEIEAIVKFWVSVFVLPTVEPPPVSLMKLWLKQYDHDLETICYGLSEAGLKNQKVRNMTTEDVVKFASMCQIGYAARPPRTKTFRLSDSGLQKPPRRIEEGGPIVAYLSKDLADKLGDVPAGTPLTQSMFFRCLMRVADLKSGKVQRPTPATQGGQPERSKAA